MSEHAQRIGRLRIGALAVGSCFGFVLARFGFTDYDEVHAMFTFADLRLVLGFAVAVVVSAIAFRLLPIARAIPPRKIGKSVIVGGVLFGIGWAISGVCPGSALASIGEGRFYAVLSVAGIIVGSLLYRPLNAKILRWDSESCG